MPLSYDPNGRIQAVLNVDATGAPVSAGSATSVKSTAAAPTYVEGTTTNPLSTDLAGNLRVTGIAGATVKANAAAPTYVEASASNPLSADLHGGLRTVIKTSTGTDVDFSADGYQFTAASTTATLGTGATGDILDGVLVIPLTAAAGVVQIKDGSGTARTIFAGGGTTALPTLAPFFVPLGAASTGGAWSVITNANVQTISVGKFTP